MWKVAHDEGYQEFYDNWRKKSTGTEFHNTFPYKLTIGALPFRAEKELGGNIVVTESYDRMYHRLLRLRVSDDEGMTKGAVLTGQPGIGAPL